MFEICISQFDGFGRKPDNLIDTLPKFYINFFDLIRCTLNFRIGKLLQKQSESSRLEIFEYAV